MAIDLHNTHVQLHGHMLSDTFLQVAMVGVQVQYIMATHPKPQWLMSPMSLTHPPPHRCATPFAG